MEVKKLELHILFLLRASEEITFRCNECLILGCLLNSKQKVKTNLQLLLSAPNPNQPRGHILFYMPVSPKSAKITFMPVAERLVQQGHRVTVITPYKSDADFGDGYRDIDVMTEALQKQIDQFSVMLWGNSETKTMQKLKAFATFWNEKTKQVDEVS